MNGEQFIRECEFEDATNLFFDYSYCWTNYLYCVLHSRRQCSPRVGG